MCSNQIIKAIYHYNFRGIFFWLEDENIKMFVPSDAQVTNEDRAFIKSHKNEFVSILKLNNVNSRSACPVIYRTSTMKMPLSFGQERLWFLNKLNSGSSSYHIPMILRLGKSVDLDIFINSLRELIKENEILRTIIKPDGNDGFIQEVISQDIISDPIMFRETNSEADLKHILKDDLNSQFNLEQEIPIRVTLYKVRQQTYSFACIVIHHIAFDGWSLDVFLKRLQSIYNELILNGKCVEKKPKVQYKDYALWQKEYLTDIRLKHLFDFWKRKLSGFETLKLLHQETGRETQENIGKDIQFTLRETTSRQLRLFSKMLNVSLYSLILSAFNLMLAAFSHQNDIVVGSPVASRQNVQLKDVMGFFVNTLVLRSKISFNLSLHDYIKYINHEVLEAQSHQELPFDLLVKELDAVKNSNRNPIFQVMFTLQNFGVQNTITTYDESRDLKIELMNSLAEELYKIAYFDMTVSIDDSGQAIKGNFNYASNLFDDELIKSYINTFCLVLDQYARFSKHAYQYKVSDIDYVSRCHTIKDNSTLFERGHGGDNIISLFNGIVKKYSNSIAVISGYTKLSYGELNNCANNLSLYLKNTMGISKGQFVAVYLDQNEKLIVSMLAILKCGAIYVPVSPDLPFQKARHILMDTGAKVLISNNIYLNKVKELSLLQIINLDNDEIAFAIDSESVSKCREHLKSSDIAYVMYTSGTTGKSKGVVIEHGALITTINALSVAYSLAAQPQKEVILQFANMSFDVSIKQIFMALLNGHELLMPPKDLYLENRKFVDYLIEHEVTHIGSTPSLIEHYDLENIVSLRRLALGGESLSVNQFRNLASKLDVPISNEYGTTETCITSTFNPLNDNVSIGKELPNVTCNVLGESKKQLPAYAVGELYIGGRALARGYLNNEELTQQKFIDNPYQTADEIKLGINNRLYKTGDIVYRDVNENIHFIGRNDNQVKINGQRIELSEIESCISSFKGIAQAVAMLRQTCSSSKDEVEANNSSKFLVAYYTTTEAINEQELYAQLHQNLPRAAYPKNLIRLNKMPLTDNGKIDRNQLLNVEFNKPKIHPVSKDEQEVINIWADVLNMDANKISTDDNFFELGGSSILAIKLIAKLNQKFGGESFKISSIFTKQTIKELANQVNALKVNHLNIMPHKVINAEDQVLSYSQEGLWLAEKYSQNRSVYNIPVILALKPSVKIEVLERCLVILVEKHQALRTVFKQSSQGKLYQETVNMDDSSALLKKIRHKSNDDLIKAISKEMNHCFDLSLDIPVRFSVHETAGENFNKRYFLLVCNHIAFDGWSGMIFFRELIKRYQHFDGNKLKLESDSDSICSAIQYKDYAIWQRSQQNDQRITESLEYWKKELMDAPTLNLVTDYQRKRDFDYYGESYSLILEEDVFIDLKQVSQSLGVSFHNLMLSAYCMLLHAYTNQSDIIIGLPFANRAHHETQSIIGLFVNLLPFRVNIDEKLSLRDWVIDIDKKMNRLQTYQSIPLEKIIRSVGLEPSTSRHPLFQTVFTLEEYHYDDHLFEKVDEELSTSKLYQIAKLDLSIAIKIENKKLSINCNYAKSLYKRDTISRILMTFKNIFNEYIHFFKNDKLDSTLNTINYNDGESCFSLYKKNKNYITQDTMVTVFERHAKANVNKVALINHEQIYTYGELNDAINQMANYIDKTYVIHNEALIPLCLEKSNFMLVAIMAVIKLGAAYVPIDPTLPDHRITQVIEEIDAPFMIVSEQSKKRLESISDNTNLLIIDDSNLLSRVAHYPKKNLNLRIRSNNLAYTIFTSGSTGKPKGVLIEHRSVLNLLYSLCDTYEIFSSKDDEVILFSSNYAFDPSVEQIILSLLTGNTLAIMSDEMWFKKQELYDYMNKCGVTHINAPPSILKEYDFSHVASLKRVVFGGEALTSDAVDYQLIDKGVKIVNVYGPTEGTIISTMNFVNSHDLSIGSPIHNVSCYILDERMKPVALGAIGELYIGGEGLARGYFNNSELTTEKFIPNPYQTIQEKVQGTNKRIYKTGDLVRLSTENHLIYVGRKDLQTKIRGFRIELEEIEKTITEVANITHSVACICESNTTKNPYIYAYYVAETQINEALIINHLASKLPSYMIPKYFIHLASLPMLNGKLNRKALPNFEANEKIEIVAPRNETEQKLSLIWSEVLGYSSDKSSIYNDFFNLGGDSITSIRLIDRINSTFNVAVSVADIIRYNTIELMSGYIEKNLDNYRPIVLLSENHERPNLFMLHPASAGCEIYRGLAESLSNDYNCLGVQSYNLYNINKIHDIHELSKYYLKHIQNTIATSSDKSYNLLGWSLGGKLALNIAYLLESKGIKNINLYLIDYVHADKKISSFMRELDLLKMKQTFQNQLKCKGMAQNYIEKIIDSLNADVSLGNQGINFTLNDTRVLSFKAMLPSESNDVSYYNEYFHYIKSLKHNNLEALVSLADNLVTLPIENSSHETILSESSLISGNIRDYLSSKQL